MTETEEGELRRLQDELGIPAETARKIFAEEDAAYKARQASAPPERSSTPPVSTGDASIADSVVKGNIVQSRDQHIHYHGAEARGPLEASLVVCPTCGRRNEPKGTFKCVKCGRDHLCLDHFEATVRACEDCVAKDEAARAEAERKRRAEQEAAEAEARKQAEAEMPTTLELDCGHGVAMKFVLIPAGKFTMGSPAGEKDRDKDEGPQREVTISKAFHMGVTEVTQAQWKAVMGTEPWSGKPRVRLGAVHAASYISWDDGAAFCSVLSKKTGKAVRLPTEAEWEYACRAGSQARFSFGGDDSKLGDYAWCKENALDKDEEYAHAVARKKPNAWGLYDMHGDAFEWCADWYADSYENAESIDPKGPDSGSDRVLRGGSWYVDPSYCRSANRTKYSPGNRSFSSGFRVVVSLD